MTPQNIFCKRAQHASWPLEDRGGEECQQSVSEDPGSSYAGRPGPSAGEFPGHCELAWAAVGRFKASAGRPDDQTSAEHNIRPYYVGSEWACSGIDSILLP